jgi:hypothetical protein
MRARRSSPSARGPRRTSFGRAAGWTATLALLGCDIPTEPPLLDTRWILPAEETRFGVAELLPGQVTITPDGSAFLVDFDPVLFSESLGSLCPLCVAANGLTVPKPPFLDGFASSVDFPAEVSSISLVSGDILIEIENGLNFDPLRPAPGQFGDLSITVTDGADGDVLGTLLVDGTATAMPPGTTLLRTMVLASATVQGSIVASVLIDSPTGDPVTIDTSDLVRVTVTPTNIVVADVTIDVAGRVVSLDPVELDVDLDDQELMDDLEERLLAGGFVLDVENPFAVGASFQLTVAGPGISTIQKSANVTGAPTSRVAIAFTLAELRSFLGEGGVTLSGGAVIDPAANPITVRPGQELVLTGKLDLTLRIG